MGSLDARVGARPAGTFFAMAKTSCAVPLGNSHTSRCPMMSSTGPTMTGGVSVPLIVTPLVSSSLVSSPSSPFSQCGLPGLSRVTEKLVAGLR